MTFISNVGKSSLLELVKEETSELTIYHGFYSVGIGLNARQKL